MHEDDLKQLHYVEAVSIVSTRPGDRFSVEGLAPDVPRDEDAGDPAIRFLRTDEDFIPLMGIDIFEGRNHRRTSGDKSEFVLNESAKRALRLDNPVGIRATSVFGKDGEIVGICRDFHYASLQQIIEPLVIEVNPDPENRVIWVSFIMVRLAPGNILEMISGIEAVMKENAEGTDQGFCNLCHFHFLPGSIRALCILRRIEDQAGRDKKGNGCAGYLHCSDHVQDLSSVCIGSHSDSPATRLFFHE